MCIRDSSATRDEAIAKMRRALDEFLVEGIQTTIPFHRKLMDDERFQEGNFTTGFINEFDMWLLGSILPLCQTHVFDP